MQIKIIKKILAAMIVASTISTTPILASALPPQNGAKEKSNQKNESENNPGKKPTADNKMFLITRPEVKKQPPIEKKNQPQNVVKNPLDDDIQKINYILSKPFHSELERIFLVQTIKNFSKDRFFKDWAKTKVDNILNILRSCLSFQDLHQDIATIISDMVEAGCFENLPENKISEMLNFLAQCSCSAAAKKNVLIAISSLVKSKFLENSSSEMIFDVVCILGECSRDMENEINVAVIMKYLASGGYFKSYNQNQINTVLGILNNCAKDDFSKREVAYTIKYLIDLENFQNWPLELVDILDKCSFNSGQPAGIFGSGEAIMSAISRLVERDCFEKCSQTGASKIVNILFRCSGCGCGENEIENIIKYLKEKGYLKHWLEKNIAAKKISTLFKNSEKSEETSKKSESDAESDESYHNAGDQTSESLESDIEIDESKQKKSDDENKKEATPNETAKNHDVVIDLGKKKTTGNKIKKTDTLNKPEIGLLGKKTNRDDEANSLDKNFAETIKNLVKKECCKPGHIGNLSDDKISKIIHMLRYHYNNGGSKKCVAMSIEWLANRNLLRNCSKAKILQIVDILNACADDLDAKKFVAKAITVILQKDFFSTFSTSELKDVKKVLIKCLDGEGAKTFIALAIVIFAEKGLPV